MKIDERKREILLSKLEREFPSGFRIPEEVNGIEIRRRVIETAGRSEDEREALKNELLELERNLVRKLEKEEIDDREGEELFKNIMGIRKAVMLLEAEEARISERIKEAEKEDYMRWKKFIERIRGTRFLSKRE
ncbi:MAG: hypothetical protein H5T47_05430 [Archaeoglobi archaeon]|nr:hypothetical protein [Candidatus Mnemosynella bozhongmuii]